MTGEPRIVIVGAGQAGGNAAFALRAAGYEGAVVVVGEEPHPPYERPPLSKAVLTGEREVVTTRLRPDEAYGEHDITLRLGLRCEAIERTAKRVVLADGTHLAYDKLMLATGARVRRLSVPGVELEGVHYLRDIADCAAIRGSLERGRRVVVVGAGYIGLEVAASAHKMGAEVVVLEVTSLPINRVVAPEMSRYFLDLHARHGVTIHTGVSVAAIEGEGRVAAVVTTEGDRLPADAVVIGVGIVPNDELASAAGLDVEDGMVVDELGRTNDADIFAAGDATRHFNPFLGRSLRLESWQNAQNQAIAVAKAMVGGEEAYAEVPWFWSDQYDVNLQIVGAPQHWDQAVRRDGTGEDQFTLLYLDRGVLVAANTINQGRDIRPSRQLIASKRALDTGALADPAVKLGDLARG